MRAQDLDRAEVGEDHDRQRDEEGHERRIYGESPVEDAALQERLIGVKFDGLQNMRPVTYALNDERN